MEENLSGFSESTVMDSANSHVTKECTINLLYMRITQVLVLIRQTKAKNMTWAG